MLFVFHSHYLVTTYMVCAPVQFQEYKSVAVTSLLH